KERRRAERLQDRRLLDAEAGGGAQSRLAEGRAAPVDLMDDGHCRRARHAGIAEAVVVLEPPAGGDHHAAPDRLMLCRDAEVIARRRSRGACKTIQQCRALAVPVGEYGEQLVAALAVVGQADIGLVTGVMPVQIVEAVEGEVAEG